MPLSLFVGVVGGVGYVVVVVAADVVIDVVV